MVPPVPSLGVGDANFGVAAVSLPKDCGDEKRGASADADDHGEDEGIPKAKPERRNGGQRRRVDQSAGVAIDSGVGVGRGNLALDCLIGGLGVRSEVERGRGWGGT